MESARAAGPEVWVRCRSARAKRTAQRSCEQCWVAEDFAAFEQSGSKRTRHWGSCAGEKRRYGAHSEGAAAEADAGLPAVSTLGMDPRV